MVDVNYLLLVAGHKPLTGTIIGINIDELRIAVVKKHAARFESQGINVEPAELIAYSVSSNDYDDYNAHRRQFFPGTLNPLRPSKKLTNEEYIVLIGTVSEVDNDHEPEKRQRTESLVDLTPFINLREASLNGSLSYWSMTPPVVIIDEKSDDVADEESDDVANEESDDVAEDDNTDPSLCQFIDGAEKYLHEWSACPGTWEVKEGVIGDAFNHEIIEMGYIIHPEFMTSGGQLPANFFVRPSYKRLMSQLWYMALESSTNYVMAPHVLITGTPGIGKSAFLFYALMFLLDRLKVQSFSIVLQIFGCAPVVFENGAEPSSRTDIIKSALSKRTTWYLFDAKPEINVHSPDAFCSGFTLFASSPSYKASKWVHKGSTCWRQVIPLWNLAELCACRQSCFEQVTVYDLFERVRKFSGVARHTLAPQGCDKADLELKCALSASEVEVRHDLRNIIGQSFIDTKQPMVRHLLFPVNKGRSSSLAFASLFVRDELLKGYGSHSMEVCKEWLNATTDEFYAPLRGQIFEAYAHRRLQQGGDYRIRDLTSYAESTLSIPACESFTFNSLTELTDKGLQRLYVIPAARNFAAVDSLIITNDQWFQMTVSLNHPLKMHPLDLVLKVVKPTSPKVYYVIPKDKFALFKKQRYLRQDGKNAIRLTSWVQKVTQYVMCMEM